MSGWRSVGHVGGGTDEQVQVGNSTLRDGDGAMGSEYQMDDRRPPPRRYPRPVTARVFVITPGDTTAMERPALDEANTLPGQPRASRKYPNVDKGDDRSGLTRGSHMGVSDRISRKVGRIPPNQPRSGLARYGAAKGPFRPAHHSFRWYMKYMAIYDTFT